MSDPKMIKGIQDAVSIPVMAKCRIGHFVEAQILQAVEIDYIDESEVLSPADDIYHIDKTQFKVPFVCGARDLGEALRRINEGASMIRTKGEPGTGDVVQASASPLSPFLVATIEVTSSGRDVPIATIVRPMKFWLTPKLAAMIQALSTTRLPPNITAIRPPAI